jgi:hypothetical protein
VTPCRGAQCFLTRAPRKGADNRPCATAIQPVKELGMSVRVLAAEFARALLDTTPSETERAQGMPGNGLARGPPANQKAGGSHHRFSRSSGIPCATVLTVSCVLSLGNRAFLPPSSARSSLTDLTPASGCQDHTPSPSASAPFVRTKIARAAKASIASCPACRDDSRSAPLAGPGRADHASDLGAASRCFL